MIQFNALNESAKPARSDTVKKIDKFLDLSVLLLNETRPPVICYSLAGPAHNVTRRIGAAGALRRCKKGQQMR